MKIQRDLDGYLLAYRNLIFYQIQSKKTQRTVKSIKSVKNSKKNLVERFYRSSLHHENFNFCTFLWSRKLKDLKKKLINFLIKKCSSAFQRMFAISSKNPELTFVIILLNSIKLLLNYFSFKIQHHAIVMSLTALVLPVQLWIIHHVQQLLKYAQRKFLVHVT